MVYQKLSSFLEKNRKGEKQTYTHTIYSDTSNIKGSYTIPTDKLDEFYGLVHKSIFKKKGWAISFLEETYLFIKRNEFVINKEEDYKTFSDKNLNFQMENNKNSIDLLKAIKQTYNKSLNSNKMQYNED